MLLSGYKTVKKSIMKVVLELLTCGIALKRRKKCGWLYL
jgi:hypothetical protein